MKNTLFFLIFLFLLYWNNLFAFDSASVFISSPNYDYLNPVFENKHDPYNYGSEPQRVAFERHSGSASEIILRRYNFSSDLGDVIIIQNGFKNINPSFTTDMIVWQSNKNGNWDLYYSIFNGSIWSAPKIVDSTSGDEINPHVHYSGYHDIRCLVYTKGNDVYFRHFRNGSWQADTNITSSVNEICSNALLLGNSNSMSVYYLKNNPGENIVIRQPVYIHFQTYEVGWAAPVTVNAISSPKNLRLSSGYATLLNYDRDSSGVSQSFAYETNLNNNIRNFSSGIPGKSMSGKGSFFAVVIDNAVENYFFAYALLNKYQDSSFIIATRWKNVYSLLGTKKFYLGDTSINSRFGIGRPIMQNHGFRMRLIWEKMHNGKMALFESNYRDFLSDIQPVTGVVSSYELHQNYPNPFNPVTNIKFDIVKQSIVKLRIYDAIGREIAVPVNQILNSGVYEYQWNGNSFTSGVYYYRLETEGFTETKKMLLLK